MYGVLHPNMTAQNFRDNCEVQFRVHAEEFQWHHPGAEISHVCVRTKNNEHLAKVLELVEQLGDVTPNYKTSDVEKKHPMWIVELHEPLTDNDLQARHMIITSPKPDMSFTRVQMIVGADPRIPLDSYQEYQSQIDDVVRLKSQLNSAKRILEIG